VHGFAHDGIQPSLPSCSAGRLLGSPTAGLGPVAVDRERYRPGSGAGQWYFPSTLVGHYGGQSVLTSPNGPGCRRPGGDRVHHVGRVSTRSVRPGFHSSRVLSRRGDRDTGTSSSGHRVPPARPGWSEGRASHRGTSSGSKPRTAAAPRCFAPRQWRAPLALPGSRSVSITNPSPSRARHAMADRQRPIDP